MKLPKELRQNKKKEDETFFFVHSKCHMAHWKLIWNNVKEKFCFICRICGSDIGINVKDIKIDFFKLDPCACGCGNIALYSKCCSACWELTYDKEKKKFSISCEQCYKVQDGITMQKIFIENVKCTFEEYATKDAKGNPCVLEEKLDLRTIIENENTEILLPVDFDGVQFKTSSSTIRELENAKQTDIDKYR